MSLVSGEKSNFQFVSHPLQYRNIEIEFIADAAARIALAPPARRLVHRNRSDEKYHSK